jgi:hypothetical protein
VTDLEALKQYATPEQVAAIDALVAHGSYAAASDATGKPAPSLRRLVGKAKKRAARQGYAPAHDMTKVAAPGFAVKGTSTLYDAKTGEAKIQWVKTQRDREDEYEAWREAIADLCEPLRGKAVPVAAPSYSDADLASLYVIGDHHAGMYAWGEEAGEDYDLEIAERLLSDAVDKLVALSPPSELGVIISVGDFFHADDPSNRTAHSGHALDVDTRHSRVVRAGLRMMRCAIDRGLQKHQRIHVVTRSGNHDFNTSIAMGLALSMFYENEPRVTVDTSPSYFTKLRHGGCLVGITHGDTVKPDKLPGVMACDWPRDWGECHTRLWVTGHVHHESRKEYPGCTVETFRTLAAKDAWHAQSGYRSGRSMDLLIMHKDHGEVNRHRVGISQLTRGAA